MDLVHAKLVYDTCTECRNALLEVRNIRRETRDTVRIHRQTTLTMSLALTGPESILV